jgi:hypothetical protein
MWTITINGVNLYVSADYVRVNKISNTMRAVSIKEGDHYVNLDVFSSDEISIAAPQPPKPANGQAAAEKLTEANPPAPTDKDAPVPATV